jgi:formylglycine-generating enzyme
MVIGFFKVDRIDVVGFVFITLLITSCGTKDGPENVEMVWIPGGEFLMGTDEELAYDHERPAQNVRLNGFWISTTEVTNRQYKKFVDATGYQTVAERKPTWEELSRQLPPGTPKPSDDLLVAGSLVFVRPDSPVTLNDYSQWWMFVPGADWQHPEGPESNLEGRWDHPVVHMAYEDAQAYCEWAGQRMPTEAEWELASRGGKTKARYGWGDELTPQGKNMANIFQGSFPFNDLKEDGFAGTSPVKSFAPNGYGVYDMIGNVWEWTSDLYDVGYYQTLSADSVNLNPRGPLKSFDPIEPYTTKRVTKGGSYLCASDYCSNYRPSARQGSAVDSGSSNIGFRTVKDKK